jgi:hypothetical protein
MAEMPNTIDSRKASIRAYRRNGTKLETAPAIIADDITLVSLDVTLALATIYEDVDFGRNARVRAR